VCETWLIDLRGTDHSCKRHDASMRPLFLRHGFLHFVVWHSYVRLSFLGSVLTGFLPGFPSQIWVSLVTFVTFFGDKKRHASRLSHFWEECDALAHENNFFILWRFLSHPSRKTSHFGTAGTKLFWTGRNVTIRLGLKNAFVLPSQISHSLLTYLGSVKRAGLLG